MFAELKGDSLLKKWLSMPGRHLSVLALVCFGVLLSLLCFAALRSLETAKAHAAFHRASQERFDQLQSDVDTAVSRVAALGAFCEASDPVTRNSFRAFVTSLFFGHDSTIQVLEWAPEVTLSARAAFEKAARDEGSPDYEIRDGLPRRKLMRAPDRSVYFPVRYALPDSSEQSVMGFDISGSGAGRHHALLLAASTGEITATQRIALVSNSSGEGGVLIVRPVYRPSATALGQVELRGFAAGLLRIRTVVEKHGATSGVDLVLHDLSVDGGPQLLYPTDRMPPAPSARSEHRTIVVGGRAWEVTALPSLGAFPVNNTYSYAGGAICLLFTLLVAVFLADSLDRRQRVERLIEERTGALKAAISSLAEVHSGLEESEARYRRLVEDSPAAIVVERSGKIVFANRSALEMFGFDATIDGRDRRLIEFVLPEHKAIAGRLFRSLYAKEMQIPSRETRLVRHDGNLIDVEYAISSFLQGEGPSIQVVLYDVTQRKRDEAENARLISAIEQAGEAIVITDLDARIVYVNPAFEKVTGYTREEALGQNPRVLKSGKHSTEFYTALWSSLKAGEPWTGRFVNRSKNGRLFTEEATITPVLNRAGQVINYVAVKRDVTLETELQEQLHQSQKMDAIGRLAGGVAHDFNNMLMVIISYADLIESSLPPEDPLRKHTAQVTRAAQRSSALTRQLLAFSRKQVLAPQILNCNTIIAETSSMVRRLISEDIELQCELAPDLWKVKADADQIVQVLLNLCVNSRDAMPNGGTLTLSTCNYHVDHGFVEISVADTGVGIPVELQEKLFEPFFTTKARGKGTGLGLATVYGIVQQSGGYIRVHSSPGNGATFTIHLPRCLEFAASPDAPVPTTPADGRSLVLVVEDEEALRQAIADHLRNHGYQVLTAEDGVDALTVLGEYPDVRILVSDLIMPRMGGRELVRLAVQQNPRLQILFMSGYTDQALSEKDFAGRPPSFLQKPFHMNVLLARISEMSHWPAPGD